MKERAVNGTTTEIPAIQEMTIICAWCKQRERTGDTWGPLCSDPNAPGASHGICPACFVSEEAKLAQKRRSKPR